MYPYRYKYENEELLSYFDSIVPPGLPPCASEWEDDEDEDEE